MLFLTHSIEIYVHDVEKVWKSWKLLIITSVINSLFRQNNPKHTHRKAYKTFGYSCNHRD